MQLKSPQTIAIPFSASLPFTYNLKDQYGNEIPRILLNCILPTDDQNKLTISFKVEQIKPTEKQIIEYFSMENFIKISVTNAELIHNNLRNYVLQDLCSNLEERSEIHKMDFMKIKDFFFDYIKKDEELKRIPIIDTPEKFKGFRIDVNSFIIDRNIYTHGQLKLRWPTEDFVIGYLSKPNMEPAHVIVNNDILISYNNFFKIINSFLSDFHTILRQRKK